MNYQTEVLKFTQILTSIRESNEDRNVVTELKKCLPFISLDKRYKLLVENKTIHLAAVKGYVDTIRHLLDDISVEQKVELLKLQNSYGNTAIHRAALRGHTDTIKCLLDGVSVDQKVELVKILNRYGDTAIHRAVWENYTETIKSLLDCVLGDQKVELLKLQNSCGNTAIHCAAWDGDTDTVQCLLDYISLQQKIELLKMQSGEDATAIHCAVWDGNTDIIKCLLDGVSVDRKVELLKVQRSDGNTAMHCSAMRGHTETINCLLDGVSVDQKVELLKIQNGYGTTAIHRTALRGHKDTINSLLDGILVDQKVELLRIQDTDGWTAIHRAALRGHTDTIKCLLDGVPVEQQVELLMIEDIDGDTAMQKATEANQTETFALLTSQLTAEQNTNHFNISNNAGKLPSDVGVDEEIFEPLPVPAKHRVGSTNQIEERDFWNQQKNSPLQNNEFPKLFQSSSYQPKSAHHWQLLPSVQPSSLQTVPQFINLKPALSQPFLQPTNGSHLMPSVPTPSTPQWFSRPENPTVSVPSQSPQLNAPSSNHSADWSPFNPPSFTNMISTNPSHLDHESNIHREVNTYFERPLPPMASSSNKVSPGVHIHEGSLRSRETKTEHEFDFKFKSNKNSLVIQSTQKSNSFIQVFDLKKQTVEAPTHSTTLSHDLTSDRESSQLSQLNTVPPHQDNSNIATPHYNVSVEKTMDNLMHSTEVPYLIDSVVAAPHQNILATVAVRQTVSLPTTSDEPFKSKVKNCKVTVKVQGENTVYSFEDHMTIGDLRRSIKEDCETGVMCRVVDEDKSRYSDSLRLGLVDVPFSIFVGDQETLVTERVNDKQAGQELSAPNAAKDFQYVQTPEQAIQLMEYVHKQLASKRAKSIHDALKPTGKCRKTIDRFRYIYYLSVLDKNKLVEIIGQWMDKAKKGGMCALGKLCEEATDWSKVVEAANDGKLTIFGMKKDK